ncbi:MAG TPA: hypothetical protein IGS53_01535 [Leptolyngbyaceae cyanobacterium M33_DOE_097]|uniref:Uncharacterized protein n=1 Tax=Oscillatoriales cyanobacterium SpSt-418 TaxID=2282169 RepID=A0A7C3PGM2_9CYAN|nr:hypothetical protein [Leptolyngbyaceae cyanobacterium M33_DOE_097]
MLKLPDLALRCPKTLPHPNQKSVLLKEFCCYQGDRLCNLRLTSPVPSVNEQSIDLATLNVWLADHSTPTRTTLRGL